MKVFKSSRKFDEYFKRLPLTIKNKAIKELKELKEFPFIAKPIKFKPIKNYKDTYRYPIDNDYSFVLEYHHQILLLLFVGKNEEDFTR